MADTTTTTTTVRNGIDVEQLQTTIEHIGTEPRSGRCRET